MFADSAAGNNSVTTWHKRNNHYVCTTLFSLGADRQFAQPYTGPCLSQPPYPINYDSSRCVGSPNQDYSINDDTEVRYRCFDSLNKYPEIRLAFKKSGNRTLLVEGSGKKCTQVIYVSPDFIGMIKLNQWNGIKYQFIKYVGSILKISDALLIITTTQELAKLLCGNEMRENVNLNRQKGTTSGN